MDALGRALDFSSLIVPVSQGSAGLTGPRVHMRNYDHIAFVVALGVASAGTDTITVTLQEHNAASAGTSQNLAVITEWYVKDAVALNGTQAWERNTQAAAATIALTNALVPAANQALMVFEVQSQSLSADFEWLSVNVAGLTSTNTRLTSVLYTAHGLKIQRRPDLLAQPNA